MKTVTPPIFKLALCIFISGCVVIAITRMGVFASLSYVRGK